MLGIFLLLPSFGLGMDTLTEAEMDAIKGRAGVALAAGEDFNFARISFSAFFWGDPDGHRSYTGWGYLLVSGDGTHGVVGLGVNKGGILTLDAGTTDSNGQTFDGVNIPASTQFIQIMADAPVGRGLELNLDSNGKAAIGLDDDNNTTIDHQLGKIGISDLYTGAVADNDSSQNEVKMWIWVE